MSRARLERPAPRESEEATPLRPRAPPRGPERRERPARGWEGKGLGYRETGAGEGSRFTTKTDDGPRCPGPEGGGGGACEESNGQGRARKTPLRWVQWSKAPPPLPQPLVSSLPPSPRPATNTDGIWDGAWSGAEGRVSQPRRAAGMSGRGPGACARPTHAGPLRSGRPRGRAGGARVVGRADFSSGDEGEGGWRRAGPGAPHLLQGAPPPPPVRSRCRRFLNQLLTCVSERPVSVARRRFSSGVG